jgi:hypothetical protein
MNGYAISSLTNGASTAQRMFMRCIVMQAGFKGRHAGYQCSNLGISRS